jgi:nitrite reductase (NO-forming)
MLTRRATLFRAAGLAAAPLLATAARAEEAMEITDAIEADLSRLPRRKQKLVAPPFVHAHEQMASGGPAIVEFEMEIVEKEVQIAADAWLQAMTFNGTMPGPDHGRARRRLCGTDAPQPARRTSCRTTSTSTRPRAPWAAAR